jgi:pimeloyl-ACP methyl ester carboxylesterase
MPTSYAELPNQTVQTDSGETLAYRDTRGDGLPLVLLQHFRGNLDNWDPALIDELAAGRRVITFDNFGVGGSSGPMGRTMAEMAAGAITFLDALKLEKVDLLGFSIGSFIAQEIALSRPTVLNKIVLASSAPKGAPGMHGWAPEVIGAVGRPDTTAEEYLSVFFTPSAASTSAGQQVLGRIYGRQDGRDEPTSWECRNIQYDAVCEWGIPDRSLLERVEAIRLPVFVANGDSDPMILPRYSYLLAGLLPDAQLKIYPDSAHGFLFQHNNEFARDVDAFLST